MKTLTELVQEASFAHRAAAGGQMFWLTFEGASFTIEFAAFEEQGMLRLLFRFGDEPVDTTADLLTYYLQLNSDMSLGGLYLAEDDRLYLAAAFPLEGLDAAGFEWLVATFGESCDYLYPDLVVDPT